MTKVEITARRLFADMECNGIRYAVLRNHEHLFSLRKENGETYTDIDLVVHSRDLDLFRGVFARIAAEAGWDNATECDHWAQSPMRCHNIEVFRLFVKESMFCFQIDVFHALLVHGVPLAGEDELLSGARRDAVNGVMRINPHIENAHRMAQIANLPDAPRKRERYRRRLLAHYDNHRDAFLAYLRPKFGRSVVRALAALEENRLDRGQFWIAVGRAWFFARYALRRPVSTARLLFHRSVDQFRRFYSRQCGFVIRLHEPREEMRAAVRSVLDDMVRANFMNEWLEPAAGRTGIREHVRMEQGALVVRWVASDDCDLDFRSCRSHGEIASALVEFLASRHQPLTSLDRVLAAAEPS